MSIFIEIMKEELERNISKQQAFSEQMNVLPKGYLFIMDRNGKKYVYRKYRDGNKIISSYIGLAGSKDHEFALKQRNDYLMLEKGLKNLKKEEQKLRGAIDKYERI